MQGLDNTYKALTSFAIEKTLLKFGKPTYEQVVSRLNKKYNCHLPDYYEHPEYLNEILRELSGNTHNVIVSDIKKELEEFTYNKPVGRFIEVISQ